MYKDFVNVTPESGGAGTTSIAVAADENEGAARSTSLNIAGGGVTRTVSITQKKMLVENQIEVKYWLDAATSGTGKSIYLEAYANNDVASNLKINFSIDQQGPTGEWETNTPVEILINTGDNASTYDESGLASMTLTWLQIQYSDEIGQKPYAISVRGGFTGVSELNTMLWSGKFQNGVINATYQAQFKIDGVIRNFKWRIQGAHI